MTIAVNDAGDVLTLDGGAWKPAMRAVHEDTGQTIVLDGKNWVPLPSRQSTEAPLPLETQTEFQAPRQQTPTPDTEITGSAAQPVAQDAAADADATARAERVVNAATQAYQQTPSFFAQPTQDVLDKSGDAGRIVSGAGKVIGAGIGAAHAGMAALSQAAMEVFGEKGGRDALALLSVLPVVGGERMSPNAAVRAPVEALPSEPGVMTAPRNPPVLDSIDRGAANQGFAATAGKVMEAGDVDSAIAAASEATRSPEVSQTVTTAAAPPEQLPVPQATPPSAEMVAQAVKSGSVANTSKAAKQIASAYYQRAEDVGGNLTPGFTNKFLDEAESMVPQTRAGKIVAGEGPTTSLIDRIQELRDGPLSLREAQEIDEGLGNLIDGEFGMKGLSKEGYNLQQLQSTFRKMIADAGPEDIEGGTEGFDALVSARKAWAQAMKLDDLERIQNRAELQEVPSTGIRTGIRTLLSNPSRIRGYSAAEIAALRQAADRGFLGAALNVFGSRLIPVGLGAHGLATLNPASLGAAALGYGASTLSRNAATALQTRRLGNAMDVLGQGVPPAPRPIGLINNPQ